MRSSLPVLGSLCVVLVVSLTPAPSSATTVPYRDLERLSQEADAVVQGRVLLVGGRVIREGARFLPYRVAIVEVERWLKGTGRERRIELLVLGGRLGRYYMPIAGAPKLEPGQRVVAFLKRLRASNRGYVPLGLSQGVFSLVERGGRTWAVSDRRALHVLLPNGMASGRKPEKVSPIESLPLEELAARVRAAGRVPHDGGHAGGGGRVR